jgi:ketosteroid isomerase-like protein
MNRKMLCIVVLAASLIVSGITLEATQQNSELVDEFTFVTNGQQWSDAQNEVWKVVQSYWKVDMLDEEMAFYHDGYIGWGPTDAMPVDKPTCRLWLTDLFTSRKTHFISIAPAGMRLFGNVAVACYYYTQVYTDSEGKRRVEQGRWTDVLMKQDGKWLLIADHGGPNPSEED